MPTLTVKIAAKDTVYTDPETGISHESLTGHMWYSLSGVGSFGFAPIESGTPWGDGEVTRNDDIGYQSPYYYTGTIVINDEQYNTLQTWWLTPDAFDLYYVGGSNDCINFTWAALAQVGFNPDNTDGQAWPTWNADEVDEIFYKNLFGSTSGWDEDKPDDGNYHVIYGSTESDNLTCFDDTNAVYSGNGDDVIIFKSANFENLENGNLFIDGGIGRDSIQGTSEADNLDLSKANIKDVEQIIMGGGDDTVKSSLSSDGPEEYFGGSGDDILDGRNSGRALKLYGDEDQDTLYGSKYNDTLDGGADADILEGGSDFDTYIAGDGDTIKDSDGSGTVLFGGITLSGGEQQEEGSSTYNGNNGETYTWSGGTLRVSQGGASITIKNFSNDALGIHLEPKDPPDPPPPPEPPRPRGGDPLVLDLGGNGIITTGLAAGIHFDHDGDGFRELSGFVNAEDGLLVLDRNNDGKINDGTELFGDSTRFFNGTIAPNGFAALGELDDNKDQVVDQNDAYFSQLRIFQDLNQNGQADPGELFTLAEKKIAALNLTYDNSPFVDRFGNLHRQVGSFVTESGQELTMTDVVFTMNRTLTATDMLEVPEDIAVLPDAKGYGTTYDLHQAMVRDASGRLQELVEAFVANTDRDARLALTDQILFVWTDQAEGPVTDAKKNEVLDSFFGTPSGGLWSLDPNRYEQQKDTTYYQLMRDSHLQPFFANVTYALNTRTNTYVAAFDNAVPVLATMIEQHPEDAYSLVQDVTRAIRGINPYNRLNPEAFRQALAEWQINRDPEDVFSGDTLGILESLARGASDLDDEIQGSEQNDVLHGFNGNDAISGLAGNDILFGGRGNDVLTGGAGDDIYRFALGDGKDRINNFDTTVGRVDVIELTGDIQASELVFVRSGDDLILKIGASGDEIRINSHFYQDSAGGYAVDQVRLDDGTVVNIGSSAFQAMHTLVTTITEEGDELHGTLGNDTIDGLGGNDLLFGKEGDDTLTGGSGNDRIEGDDGNDLLSGGTGADVLHGGSGNDQLLGGSGEDWLYGDGGDDVLAGGEDSDYLIGGEGLNTYRYGLGDGWDTILYPRTAITATDTLELTNGLRTEHVAIRRWENDLVLLISDGGRLRVENYFLQTVAPINVIRFSDGTVWNSAKIAEMVRVGTSQADYLYGNNDPDVLHGLEGDDNMRGYAGDDQLYGDEGNDTLAGDDGADILEGGSGNDRLSGGAGNDILIGGADTDVMEGGSGSDIYRFESGFGQDVIYNSDSSAGRMDVIEFGNGITAAMVTAERSWDNLVLRIAGGTDSITVSNYFLRIDDGGKSYVDEIRFADGTTWNVAAVKQRTTRITEGNDEIHGYAENDIIDGLGGDDSIHGARGNDQLSGGAGNDIVWGDDGNDTLLGNGGNDILYGGLGDDALTGGTGNDLLRGDGGSDTYIFGQGFGQDRILASTTAGDVETIVFGAGISAADLIVKRSGNALLLSLNNATDTLTVENYFNTGINRSAGTAFNFSFADGTSLSFSDVVEKSLVGTSAADYLFGYEEANNLSGDEGGDQLYGNGGDDVLSGGLGNDTLYGGTGQDNLAGGEGVDLLSGQAGNDLLDGGVGNDTLYGDEGDDILIGGAGNDTLNGGAGNDIYLYQAGLGSDVINNIYDPNTSTFDVIRFDASIPVADVQALRRVQDLVLLVGGTGDQIRVANYFYDHARGNYIVNEIQFADGTIWDIPTVKLLVQAATAGNDELHGYEQNDTLAGLSGNDIIYGHQGNDLLVGGAGTDTLDGGQGNDQLAGEADNDSLRGGTGDDILSGGTGNDYLDGGDGNDTYLFNRGDGQDTISNYDTGTGRVDSLQLGAGIVQADVTVKRVGNNLLLTLNDTSDSVTVSNYFANEPTYPNRLDQIKFEDGTIWDMEEVKAKVLIGTTGNDTLTGYLGNDTINGFAGNDTITGGAGDDLLLGAEGNDTLFGESGNDSLYGGEGRDTLYGGEGDDFLAGGRGDDDLNGSTGSNRYLFSQGDGHDTIYDAYESLLTIFVSGLPLNEIVFRRNSNNLEVSFPNSPDDLLTLRDFFQNETPRSSIRLQYGEGQELLIDPAQLKSLTLNGTDFADIIRGYSSDDEIAGLAGNDVVYGGAGNDTLQGGEGNDTLYGEEGDDLLTGGNGNDRLEGGGGNDHYQFDPAWGEDVILDTTGNDSVHFANIAPADLLLRRNGNDLVVENRATGGSFRIQGQFSREAGVPGTTAIEQFVFEDGTVWNFDTIKLKSLEGTTGADVIYGHVDDDLIESGAGNDFVYADEGNDTVYGNIGDDTLHGDAGDDTLYGNEGMDKLYGDDGNDVLYGGAEDDELDGGLGQDILQGGAGNDLYLVDQSGDVIIEQSGEGMDTVHASADYTLSENVESLVLTESAWNAQGTGNALSNILTGNNSDNSLFGLAGDDILIGGGGNDLLDGGTGDDSMEGGADNDTYIVDNQGDVVIEQIDGGYDTIESTLDIVLAANLERGVLLGNGALNVTGNDLDNELIGNSGNNILDGGAGADRMIGGVGDDTYRTNLAPYIEGSFGDFIVELADEGIDTEIRNYEGAFLLIDNVENLILEGSIYRGNGNELDNVLTGNAVKNNLWGLGGDDLLYGLGGDDELFGDIGDDLLDGGDGNDLMDGGDDDDTLVGGAGNDQLDGGAGVNHLRGGLGNDTYVYRSDAGVYQIDNSDGGSDWLLFTDDLTADRLSFIKSGDDLIVRVDGDENHQVVIGNWFLGQQYQLYAIQPSGANGITAATINRMFPPDNPEADGIEIPAEIVFDQQLYGTSDGEQLLGTSGNDSLRGYEGNDYLFGQGGDDWLLGGSGDDQLDGGTGNDMLYGGSGNDVYVFRSGYGVETIDNSGGGTDWLLFDTGLTLDTLVFSRVDDNLVIDVDGTDDQVTVLNWFTDTDNRIEYIQPYGGNGISAAQIEALLTEDPPAGDFDTVVEGTTAAEQLIGTSGADQLNAYAGDDQLFGLAGDDELNGGDGNDYLDGGAGNDVQNGDAGADQLGGDAGDDILVGGSDNDIYVYRAGAGADTIINTGGGTDWLIFDDGITSDRLSFIQSEDDLIIRVDENSATQVTVSNWFQGGENQLSYIQPDGESGISAAQINALFTVPPDDGGDEDLLTVPDESTFDMVVTGAATGSQIVGSSGNDLLQGLAGDDQLFGLGGNDWLVAGDGSDYLDGGSGNDTQLGGAGDDQLGGDAGDDVLSGGSGNDIYVYRAGSGNDTIINEGGGTDWLIFTDDITADRLTYVQTGDDLLVNIDDGEAGSVTVLDWFLDSEHQLSYIQPSGGYGIPAASLPIEQASTTSSSESGSVLVLSDFVSGEDVLELSKSVFTSLTDEGTLSSALFCANSTGLAQDDNDYILYNTSSGALLYDADGSGEGAAVQFASLSNKPEVSANDFLVVA